MKKKHVLSQLESDVYCQLKPSEIGGVGVFALRDIPKGINPFKEKDTKYFPVREEYIEGLDSNVRDYVKKLFVYSDGKYWLPKHGVQTLCITHYLNHSKNPNLTTNSNCDVFFTIKDVKRGEELTINYNLFDDAKEEFRR